MDNFDLMMDSYFTEKKSRAEYAIRQIKRDYKYDPKTKTVDDGSGNRMKADLDYKNPTMRGGGYNRTTCMTNDRKDPILTIGKDVVNAKNSKRRRAIIDHEIGHSKYHQRDLKNSSTMDKEMITPKTAKDTSKLSDSFGELRKLIDPEGYKRTKDQDRNARHAIDDNGATERGKLRDSAREKLRKYEDKRSGHSTVKEFEADRYSANKNGSKQTNRALRDLYKRARKDLKKEADSVERKALAKDSEVRTEDHMSKKDIRKAVKKKIAENNINWEADRLSRAKALRAKELTNAERSNYRDRKEPLDPKNDPTIDRRSSFTKSKDKVSDMVSDVKGKFSKKT